MRRSGAQATRLPLDEKKCFAVVKDCSGDKIQCDRARHERRDGTTGDKVPSGLRHQGMPLQHGAWML
jgi:hypothetical protein